MKDKHHSRIDIEKAKIKFPDLVKKAKEAAVKEQLKNDSDLKLLNLKLKDLSLGKAGIFFYQNLEKAKKFFFKKRFSVVSILLIVFGSIIATYLPMYSLYNAKPIPLIETNRANVLKCRPFKDENKQEQKGIFKCSYESEKLKETPKKTMRSVEKDVQSATENTESWLKRKWPRLYSLIFFWEKEVPNKEISIKPTNTENPADTSAELDNIIEYNAATEDLAEDPEQTDQEINNKEQESQAMGQQPTDSKNSVQSEQKSPVSQNNSAINSLKTEISVGDNNTPKKSEQKKQSEKKKTIKKSKKTKK